MKILGTAMIAARKMGWARMASMSKVDEIRERVNSTDPNRPIVMAWERDDFNYLLGEVERLQVVVSKAQSILRAVEWGFDYHSLCPYCATPKTQGHQSDCKLKAALTELEAENERN